MFSYIRSLQNMISIFVRRISFGHRRVEWISDKDGSFGTSTPSSDETIIFAYDSLIPDFHTISLNIADEGGSLFHP